VKIRAVRGMNDILPEEAKRWQHLEAAFRRTVELYGYGEVRTPAIEHTSLFAKQMGETSDVVEKEMYSFSRHDDELTVRPEGTAGAARAYVEHAVANREPISRWYYIGPMFRGERPAKGRYRQFHQAGCELFGDAGPLCDAEMIEMCLRILREVGVEGARVHLNSLGGAGTREAFRDALVRYLEPRRAELSEDSQRRLEKNPLRILDSKDPRDRAIAEGAPSILEVLSDEDRAHFDGVRAGLDALGVDYVVDAKLVRGLDYYTRTLFEIQATTADLGAQSTVCGGGRYDGMVEGLGGPKVPAIGFAMGLERLLIAAKDRDTGAAARPVYVAALDPEAAPRALAFARELRDRGVAVELDARDLRLKAMLRRADGLGARFCVLIGANELARGEVTLKDLGAHSQEAIAIAEAGATIADRVLGGGAVLSGGSVLGSSEAGA